MPFFLGFFVTRPIFAVCPWKAFLQWSRFALWLGVSFPGFEGLDQYTARITCPDVVQAVAMAAGSGVPMGWPWLCTLCVPEVLGPLGP